MKAGVKAAILLLAVTQTAVAHAGAPAVIGQHSARRPSTPMRKLGLDAQLCFFRYEDNGRINIADVKVSLSNYQTVTVEGGQAGCFYLMPGAYSFSITSPDPYSGARGADTWASPRYKVALVKGERAVYQVFPNTRGASYVRGWRAKLAAREPRLEPGVGDK
jgi:hypothetical protein